MSFILGGLYNVHCRRLGHRIVEKGTGYQGTERGSLLLVKMLRMITVCRVVSRTLSERGPCLESLGYEIVVDVVKKLQESRPLSDEFPYVPNLSSSVHIHP